MEKIRKTKLKCDNLYSLLVTHYSYGEDIKEGEMNEPCRKQGGKVIFCGKFHAKHTGDPHGR
jgi:hypothetical protein